MDDVRAVMDAAGSERAVLWTAHEGPRTALLPTTTAAATVVLAVGLAFDSGNRPLPPSQHLVSRPDLRPPVT
jgi:hypothetical protein